MRARFADAKRPPASPHTPPDERLAADANAAAAPRARRSLSWPREAAVMVILYLIYAAIRDARGSVGVTAQYGRALANARRVMAVERALHIGWEHELQRAALRVEWFVRSANVFYGSAHFLVTFAVLVWLYRRRPDRYRWWRTVLVLGTALALVGFSVFPLLPPRLLPPPYGFTDTLHALGGLWSFNSGVIERISDPFAAMPSLHLVWAAWCAAVVVPGCRRRWTQALALSYPVLTATTVVITGNHYLLDLVGGLGCLAVAAAAAAVPGWLAGRRPLLQWSALTRPTTVLNR